LSEQLLPEPASFESDGDQRAFHEIRRRLYEYEALRATQPRLELDVRHGTAHLTGRVRTQAMKEIVGYLCRQVDDVAVVRNEVISDTEVGRQVADALATDPTLGPLCLRVDVRDGIATLSGDLPSAELDGQAVEVAAQAVAAEQIVSALVVRPAVRPPTAPAPTGASRTS
jgi:osmotically-inducible protein OsmY